MKIADEFSTEPRRKFESLVEIRVSSRSRQGHVRVAIALGSDISKRARGANSNLRAAALIGGGAAERGDVRRYRRQYVYAMHIYIYIYNICVEIFWRVLVCVCVCERERVRVSSSRTDFARARTCVHVTGV